LCRREGGVGERLARGEIAALSRLVAADDEGLSARSGVRLANAELTANDLSPREVRELKAKLRPRPVPDFDLDLGTMRPGAEIARKMDEAVPKQ